jgi:hypothetical protein
MARRLVAGQNDLITDVQRANFQPIKLMTKYLANPHRLMDIQRQLPGGLYGVRVEQNAMLVSDGRHPLIG